VLSVADAKGIVRDAINYLQGEHMELALDPGTKQPLSIEQLDTLHGYKGEQEELPLQTELIHIRRELYLPRTAFAGRREAVRSYELAAERFKLAMQGLKMLQSKLHKPSIALTTSNRAQPGLGGIKIEDDGAKRPRPNVAIKPEQEGSSSNATGGGSSSSRSAVAVLQAGYSEALARLRTEWGASYVAEDERAQMRLRVDKLRQLLEQEELVKAPDGQLLAAWLKQLLDKRGKVLRFVESEPAAAAAVAGDERAKGDKTADLGLAGIGGTYSLLLHPEVHEEGVVDPDDAEAYRQRVHSADLALVAYRSVWDVKQLLSDMGLRVRGVYYDQVLLLECGCSFAAMVSCKVSCCSEANLYVCTSCYVPPAAPGRQANHCPDYRSPGWTICA
jgi:hypothetical protein